MEEWRKVPRYRRIEVSDHGNVRAVWPHKTKKLKPMEARTTVGSYLKVSVTEINTGKQRQVGIHNLVAEAFIEVPVDKVGVKIEPNHRDGDKHNNRKENLEWMTRQENLQHAIDTGLRKVVDERGKALYVDKSKPVMVTDLRSGETMRCDSAKEAGALTGVPARTVQYNAFSRATQKPVKGYLFSKAE